ncbi:MAG TPA: phosphatidylserine/phosphatidylglycerophosphate/cardiolipin synthase family protein [Kofleriaceae bacterium]|nr:phosphatidylserine/phosphatidylglycerophosphate/cardiolipin synthase family protein [Kofleriaceae bacterium]
MKLTGRWRARARQQEPVAARTTLLAAIARYARSTYRLRRGNDVRLLRAGAETFPAMLAAIAKAQRSICFETYIFEDDRTGGRFAEAFIERVAAGVRVRFLYDAIGGFGLHDAFLGRMRDAGVELIEYHPVAPWRARFNLANRDHRKILVVDDEVAFTGGINVGDDYAAVAEGGAGWHDLHCELRGPVVIDLARLFRRTWIAEGGAPYPPPPYPPDDAKAPGTVAVRVVDNMGRRRRGAIRRAYLTAIAAAQRTVWLENAYFLPDRGLRRALARAAARGVEVAVIVPGRIDVRAVAYAGLYVHRKLAARGIKLMVWRGPMMHAKTAIIDGVWGCIGSFNLDSRSLRYNLEVVVEVIDDQVGGVLERQFALDRSRCDPFDPTAWSRLPWWRRLLAWMAAQVHNWL